MAGAIAKLPPPSTGRLLTILSIDGGGIRGLIPAVILQHLEQELQDIAGDQSVRLADYFDVIAGTSTGGLIGAMLTTPTAIFRPKFTADQIRDFYVNEGPLIFPPDTPVNNSGPKYNGEYLHKRVREELDPLRLDHALTRLVIPTFDIMQISPTIFSGYKVKQNGGKHLNALLSDICIATSAAPTYLPAHYFTGKSGSNKEVEFHMVDGGIAACNPALAAISEVAQDKKEYPEAYPMMEDPEDFTNVLLLSLGCGVQRKRDGFTASEARKWGPQQWVVYLKNGILRQPITEFMYDGSQDMVDYHLYSLFKARNAQPYYLRIQPDIYDPKMAEMDNATEENLMKLEKSGKDEIDEPVKRINPITFEFEETGEGTNRQGLRRIAEALYKERLRRLNEVVPLN